MSYDELPAQFKKLIRDYPDVCSAFEKLGARCHDAGPLDEKARKLAKLGVAIGTGSEGAVHSAVRKALQADVSKEEMTRTKMMVIKNKYLKKGETYVFF